MTGFGRGGAASANWVARVELASVNRKQAEVVVVLPKEAAELEPHVKRHVQNAISRGRVQVNIQLEPAAGGKTEVKVDLDLARGVDQAFKTISSALGRVIEPRAGDFMRQSGLFSIGTRQINAAEAWEAVGPALSEALSQINVMREREGQHLRADLEQRLDILADWHARISAAAPVRPLQYREALLRRLRETGLSQADPADERLLREVALFADRCDVSEELTRLESHFAKFHEYMQKQGAHGRALDFLCQEINRELNTIGSKANDSGIAHAVVESKTELERVREQVQNIE